MYRLSSRARIRTSVDWTKTSSHATRPPGIAASLAYFTENFPPGRRPRVHPMEPQVSGQVPAPGGNRRRLLPDCPGKQCAKTLPNLRIRKLRLRKRICINP